mmetsp:Transcript_17092/g.53391  ORF Transcript_17092/g.53391 Transcript_17092/m.53391 type:complete len:355 (-) Transcript_17092:114-1178(-)
MRLLTFVQWWAATAVSEERVATSRSMSTVSDAEKFASKDADPGAMKRQAVSREFRERLSPHGEFPPEAGRYRLYVSKACPWAHRTLMTRALKGLEGAIPVTFTGYRLDNLAESFDPARSHLYRGWDFTEASEEPHGFEYLDQVYELAMPGYRDSFGTSRPMFSVPVLFDEKTQRIVNAESGDIIRIFNEDMNEFATNDVDLAPAELREAMDEVDALVYPHVNDGVYRCGFARTQQAYDTAYEQHWNAMDALEARLASSPFLCGDTLTLSDIRLFATLIRYDAVYYSHFKTSRNKLIELPNLFRFTKRIYNMPAVKSTCDIEFIKKHYFGSHGMLNPLGIVPKGPSLADYDGGCA